MSNILDNYTNEQIDEIKKASFKIVDAYHIFEELIHKMGQEDHPARPGDLACILHFLEEDILGNNGCLNDFLKGLEIT
ncbi:MAG: hypothetical protein ACTSXG_01585 [Alphaproteobacteria bacterium]